MAPPSKANQRDDFRNLPRDGFRILAPTSSEPLTGIGSDAGAGAVVATSWPQLPQNLLPGSTFLPQSVQNIVGLPVSVYASKPFKVLGVGV